MSRRIRQLYERIQMQQRPHTQKPVARPSEARGSHGKLFTRVLPWLLIAAIVAGSVVVGTNILREKRLAEEIAPYESVFAPNIIIDNINISGMTPQQAYDALYQQHQGSVNSWTLDLTFQGHTYVTLGYPQLGISISTDQISLKLKEAWELTHTGDNGAKRASIEQLKMSPHTSYTTQSEFSDAELTRLLSQIAQNIYADPVDAKLIQFVPQNTDPFLIQEAVPGRKLNVDLAKTQILASAASGVSGDYELVPEYIPANLTQAQLRQSLALRSVAVTDISNSSPVNRTNNIRVSLSRVSGLVLKPGETFSFNKVVGRRTKENGFYEAEEYASRVLVTGIGGGVCQSSSTIYQAAVTTGLLITDRTIHSDPVNYTEAGLDATVYWSGGRQIDFKFKNSTGSNIYITAQVRSDKANSKRLVTEVRIFGESMGEGVRYAMQPVVVEVLPPPDEIVYQVDKLAQHVLYKDETLELSQAKEGKVVQTYLQKFINGNKVEETPISKDTYQPRQAVYWVGNTQRPN